MKFMRRFLKAQLTAATWILNLPDLSKLKLWTIEEVPASGYEVVNLVCLGRDGTKVKISMEVPHHIILYIADERLIEYERSLEDAHTLGVLTIVLLLPFSLLSLLVQDLIQYITGMDWHDLVLYLYLKDQLDNETASDLKHSLQQSSI